MLYYLICSYWIKKIFQNFSKNFSKFICSFAKLIRNFAKISWKIKDFILAKFHEIQNNFVNILCFAKFLKCCFTATLPLGQIVHYSSSYYTVFHSVIYNSVVCSLRAEISTGWADFGFNRDFRNSTSGNRLRSPRKLFSTKNSHFGPIWFGLEELKWIFSKNVLWSILQWFFINLFMYYVEFY